MKIKDIQTLILDAENGRTWLFVEVYTDAGLVGVGEASQSRLDPGVRFQIERLKPLYLGRNPLDLIEERNLLLARPDAGRILHAAVSGLEQALWDLCGQALDVPCYQLLGGSVRQQIPLYANLTLAAGDGSPEAYAAAAAKAAGQGFQAVKINAFYPFPGHRKLGTYADFRRRADLAVARVKEVRGAIGPGAGLLIDCSLAIPPSEAAGLVARLDEFDLFWIEEPFVYGDPESLSELRKRVTARLAVGEQLHERIAYRRLLEARAADVLMIDVKWIGGILEARKIAAMAEAWEVEISPHNMSGPVSTAASAQLAAVLPNFLILEYCFGVAPWRSELVHGAEVIQGGEMALPQTPGLGIPWNPEEARKHLVKEIG